MNTSLTTEVRDYKAIITENKETKVVYMSKDNALELVRKAQTVGTTHLFIDGEFYLKRKVEFKKIDAEERKKFSDDKRIMRYTDRRVAGKKVDTDFTVYKFITYEERMPNKELGENGETKVVSTFYKYRDYNTGEFVLCSENDIYLPSKEEVMENMKKYKKNNLYKNIINKFVS